MDAVQVVQLVGAVIILAAFALAQFGVLEVRSTSYLVANVVGAAGLAVIAYVEEQWGFFLLEVVWALVSLWSLATTLRATSAS